MPASEGLSKFSVCGFCKLAPKPPHPLHSGNNERRRKTARAVNCEFVTTFAIAVLRGPFLLRNRPVMSVSQSHACFSKTIISALGKLVAIIKRLYMVTLVSVSFIHSDSRILVEGVLQQKKRPNLLLLFCTFLPSRELARVCSPGGYHSEQFREAEYKVHHQNSCWRK